MKQLLIISLLLLCSIFSYSQDLFKYDKEGLLPKYIVTKNDSLTQSELYLKTIDWIKDTYKNPDVVIKAKFENEKIRFSGMNQNAFYVSVLGMKTIMKARYSIEIEFKEGRYKFTPINLEYYNSPSKYSSGGWTPINFEYGGAFYKKKGKLRKMFKSFPIGTSALLNPLKLSLDIYLLKEANVIKDKKDDW